MVVAILLAFMAMSNPGRKAFSRALAVHSHLISFISNGNVQEPEELRQVKLRVSHLMYPHSGISQSVTEASFLFR